MVMIFMGINMTEKEKDVLVFTVFGVSRKALEGSIKIKEWSGSARVIQQRFDELGIPYELIKWKPVRSEHQVYVRSSNKHFVPVLNE